MGSVVFKFTSLSGHGTPDGMPLKRALKGLGSVENCTGYLLHLTFEGHELNSVRHCSWLKNIMFKKTTGKVPALPEHTLQWGRQTTHTGH